MRLKRQAATEPSSGEMLRNSHVEPPRSEDTPAVVPQDASQSRLPERRQLTVLFCDLVDSTKLSRSLDPEDENAILQEYHRCCAERITKAGGFVAQFQGDGVIGYFGYQHASESDAERAVRAALELIESIPKIATGLGTTLRARVGVSTGMVVAGDPERGGTRLEQAVIGSCINLAARLQSAANANEIVIADTTRRLIGNLFVCRKLGMFALKGFDQPVRAWQVLRPRTTTSQFKAYRRTVLTEVFGREAEIDVLMGKWQQSVTGHGQIVNISGEAGIGKSRLIREFRQRIARQSHTWLEGGGSQFFQNTPLYAISQMVKRALDPAGRASPTELRTRLAKELRQDGVDEAQALPLIADLLGLPAGQSTVPVTAALGDRRDRLFAILTEWLYASARRRTLVLVVEDLHWADPSTLELIGRISRSSRPLPALVLLSMRTVRNPRWIRDRHHHLRLKRLHEEDLTRIVARVATERQPLSEDDVQWVLRRADGVPLFAVELARLMMEQNEYTAGRQIPATLSDLLMARLDQLGLARTTAQVVAVVGDEASLALLRMVAGLPEERLRSDLRRLVKAGLLERSGSAVDPIYSFRHSLIRDTAYETLLKSRRRQLHRRIAILLTKQFNSFAVSRPESLARHWEHAGEPRLAISAWRQAGTSSSARRAFREAQQAYQSALSILQSLPPSSDRDALELFLQSSLADILRVTRGYSASQTIMATARARVLSERYGDIAQRFVQVVGEWAAASSGGNYLAARNFADQVLELALADGSKVYLAHAHMIQMTSRYRIGDLMGGEDYFERGEVLFESPAFLKHPGWVAQTYGNAAQIAWIMGDEVKAQQRIDRALNIARENDSPYDIAFAQYMAAVHALLIGNLASATRLAEESIRLSDKHGFPQFAAISRIVLGRAKAGSGAHAHGIALMREGLTRMSATGIRVAVTWYMTWLGEAQLLGGLVDDALHSVEQALDMNHQELFPRPASLHLRGRLRAREGLTAEAERDFREAMQLSTQMGAKQFYDRATESLYRLAAERC